MRLSRFLLVSWLSCVSCWLQAAHVQFNLGDFTDGQLTNRTLTVTITDAPRVSTGSGRIIIGSSLTRTSDYTGLVIISNLVEATYRCTVAGTLGNAFQITVPYTNILLNAKDILTTTPASSDATSAYSQAAANARFLLRDGGYGTNTTLSNVVLLGTITGIEISSPTSGVTAAQATNIVAAYTNHPTFNATNLRSATINASGNIVASSNVVALGTVAGFGGLSSETFSSTPSNLLSLAPSHFSSNVYVHELTVTNGITFNGVRLEDWPSGTGGTATNAIENYEGLGTNTTFYTAASGTVPLTVRGTSGQSAYMLDVRDSTDARMWGVSESGIPIAWKNGRFLADVYVFSNLYVRGLVVSNGITGGDVEAGVISVSNLTASRVLATDAQGYITNLPAGTAGQIVTSTGSGYAWSNAPTAGSSLTTNGVDVLDLTNLIVRGTMTIATQNVNYLTATNFTAITSTNVIFAGPTNGFLGNVGITSNLYVGGAVFSGGTNLHTLAAGAYGQTNSAGTAVFGAVNTTNVIATNVYAGTVTASAFSERYSSTTNAGTWLVDLGATPRIATCVVTGSVSVVLSNWTLGNQFKLRFGNFTSSNCPVSVSCSGATIFWEGIEIAELASGWQAILGDCFAAGGTNYVALHTYQSGGYDLALANAWVTNLFTGITNSVLASDSNGKLRAVVIGTNLTWLTNTYTLSSAGGTSSTNTPVISAIRSNTPASTEATITFTTDVAANCGVAFGTVTNTYSATNAETSPGGTSHSVSLTGLTTNTTYYFRCLATNSNGSTISAESSFTTTAANSLLNGLVAYWRLDDGSGTTADDAVSTNNGTLVSSPVWTNGHTSGALYFAGSTSQRVSVSARDYFAHTNAKTVSFWMYPQADSASYPRLLHYSTDSSNGWEIDVGHVGSVSHNGILGLVSSGGTVTTYSTPTNMAPLNTWTHVVVMFSATDCTNIYINNVSRSLTSQGFSTDLSVSGLSIGNRGNLARPFLGNLDEIGIWTRALTPAEIETLYETGPF